MMLAGTHNLPHPKPQIARYVYWLAIDAAAAVAYAIRWRDLRRSCEAAGSGMAAVAIVALILSVVLRGFETENTLLTVNVHGDTFYGLLVGFLVLAISACLIMEWWYQDRSAGVWVILTAAVAVTALEFELVRMLRPALAQTAFWVASIYLFSLVAFVGINAGIA